MFAVFIGTAIYLALIGLVLWLCIKMTNHSHRGRKPHNHVNDPEDGALTMYNIFGIGRKPK